jgi:polysaccharide chain length determinant protein (PEP-CTERM system associated)
MDSFDIQKYVNMAVKRKWWIIVCFLITILVGFTYLLITPRIYEAQTLILVQQQKVPENYVQSIVSTTVSDRLRTITQQVSSRTNLENIINEYGLYGSSKSDMMMDSKVALLKKMITINVTNSGGNSNETSAFTISYRSEDPKKTMDVTNALASNFTSENSKIREEQALGTSTFLSDELVSVEERLKKKEEELKEYQERYMGGLPEQLQTNLSILERLQTNLDQLNSNLNDAANRRTAILKDIAASKASSLSQSSSSTGQSAQQDDLASLKNQLATLESRYTSNHPDVIRLKETIAAMEKKKVEASNQSDLNNSNEKSTETEIVTSIDQALARQLQEINLDIVNYKAKIEETNSQIKDYQVKVESTPKREQELLSLKRDYNNVKELYNSLLNRELEAGISVSMEKKQKGEQFKVIDFAKMPTTPVEPDVRKIILMTLALGLGLGCGLAYLRDMIDTSYKTPDDAEREIQLPVLVTFPNILTEIEAKNIKRKNIFAYSGVGVGFIVSVITILFVTKGMHVTINYLKSVLEKIQG